MAASERKRLEKEKEAEIEARRLREAQKEAMRQRAEALRQTKEEKVLVSSGLREGTHLSAEEKVVYARKVVDLDEAEKKLTIESTKVEVAQVGAWRVVGGKRTRCVDVVTLSKGAVDKKHADGMAGAVITVRTLFQASGREWDVAGKVWGAQGNREVMWTVSNVKVGVDAGVVRDALVTNVRALWGSEACVDAWAERRTSRYVRIDNIPEEDWVMGGWERLKGENGGVPWGHRDPTVVRRQWSNVSVKVEVESAAAAYDLVRSKAKWGGVSTFVEVCVAGAGAGVVRAVTGKGGMVADVRGRGMRGGVTAHPAGGGAGRGPTLALGDGRRCYGCGGVGHVIAFCPRRSIPIMTDDGPAKVGGTGGVKRGPQTQGARQVGRPGPVWMRVGGRTDGDAPLGARLL